ncbi:hypothetical protein C3B44_08300 [Corynebacterium yudongzhengii]|uniref:Uncharacterized protein n=1 Tax=Corynebacterium yudongzhengii TaxID=2080740 RepID=A0A2U1T7P3_9CORY|nr:hypothetical protein [Corynebacterium yudongzhengii]AWB82355.1 hypothetical protein C3B44_08300 [Corynebacterium yudongzhengii]PWC02026.1 hypothetical protein DF222_04075 [Corynebacterium yudongzhengii]
MSAADELLLTFALRDGRAIGLNRYLEAIRTCAGVGDEEAASVVEKLAAMCPGPVRPVIRAHAGTMSVSRRPLPASMPEVQVLAEAVPDARVRPAVPGADLGWLNQQLNRVISRGADDALLRITPGLSSQTLSAALVCFAEEQAFVSTHPSTSPSVLVDMLLDELAHAGIPIRHRAEGLSRALMTSNETWTVSAVHGIRRVRGWLEYGSALPAAQLPAGTNVPSAVEMDARMWELAQPVADFL